MKLEQEYISLSSIAEDLDCAVRTIQMWARSGKIETVKLFGRILVEKKYYDEWKQRNIVKRSVG